jgi:serine/threonine-protein kinase
MAEVARQSESARRESESRSEAEKRQDLFRDATAAFRRIGDELKATIMENAPSADFQAGRNGGWSIRINQARLELSAAQEVPSSPWGGWDPPSINVIARASVGVRIPAGRTGYEGRSHSLWFCDARDAGRYGWFETAFMITPLIRRSEPQAPFAMEPGEGAAKALWRGMAEYQLAWPFTPLVIGELDEFIDRWAAWFADGAQGRLQHPSTMPERPAEGSWRR